MLILWPRRWLSSVDFPTLGRPTIATYPQRVPRGALSSFDITICLYILEVLHQILSNRNASSAASFSASRRLDARARVAFFNKDTRHSTVNIWAWASPSVSTTAYSGRSEEHTSE